VRRRRLTHPLESVRYRSAARRRVRPAKAVRAGPGSTAIRHCGGECAVPPLEIEVQAMRLSPYRTGLAGRHRQRLRVSPASLTCSCPLQLSPSGESDGPEVSLRTSPGCTRNPTSRPAAHTFTASGSLGSGDFLISISHRVSFRQGDWDHPAPSGLHQMIPEYSSIRTSLPCRPSPCTRLSRAPTTMAAPTPLWFMAGLHRSA
jgi:hypothetical protein